VGEKLAKGFYVLVAVVVAALACVGGGTSASRVPETGLPPGFVDRLVARFLAPTAMAFTPEGRLLVTTQFGVVRVIDRDGHLRSRPALDYRSRTCTQRERGMTGIAIDPHFSRNHYVYIYYTFKKFEACKTPVNRLSRFMLRADSTIDPRSETVLIDNVPSYGATHNAGDVQFGKDGYIYVGIGDGGRDYLKRTDSSAENAAARDLNVLLGKIVRITRTGGVPADNPFRGHGGVACARKGVAPLGTRCEEIYAWGLRNPWRLSLNPNFPDTRFLVNDVGESAWEEIDSLRRGADYGWNLREGFCPRDVHTRCTPAPTTITDPVYAYAHRDNCGAITGGAFVPPGTWPARFEGGYLFGDFNCGRIFLLTGVEHQPQSSVFDTRFNPGLVSMTFGPRNALYYSTYAGGGEVRRITYERKQTR
jgi:glucose/arabinose dehydrogenase